MTTAATTKVTTSKYYFIENIKYEHLLAGVTAGMTSTLILHPLDLIKIRFSVDDGRHISSPRYRGIWNALVTIKNVEGFQGLYKGLVPNLIGSGSAWGLYFLFYNTIKTFLQKGDRNKALSPGYHLLAGAQSGAMTLVITNPIWVTKTRLCLQYSDSLIGNPNNEKYKGFLDALHKIYKTEGLKGYYKGFLPGLFGVSHGAIQFMAYEEFKNKYSKYKKRPITTKLSTYEYLSFAALSKIIAVSTTYPYQVVRTRLQNQHYQYRGSIDVIRLTWKFEGVKGFYKGLLTNILRVTPATMITFLVYENFSHFLLKDTKNRK